MENRVEGLGFTAWTIWFRVQHLGFGEQGLGFRVHGVGKMV
jgi:hypothetical protein